MNISDLKYWQDFWPKFDAQFWQDFWPNAIANLIVGILLATLVAWLIDRLQKANARVVVSAVPRASRNAAGKIQEFDLSCAISNTGNISLSSGIYWYVYLSSELRADFRTVAEPTVIESRRIQTIGNRHFETYSGLVKESVYPAHVHQLFTIRVSPSQLGKYYIYYYLSTSAGFFPRKIQQDKEGKVILSGRNLGRSEILFSRS